MYEQATVFQALGDPTRLRILDALQGGERAVQDIVGALGAEQSGISRHLRILHGAGFVQVRPDGPRRLYALRPERFRELDAWMSAYRKLWEERLDRLGQSLKTKAAARRNHRGE